MTHQTGIPVGRHGHLFACELTYICIKLPKPRRISGRSGNCGSGPPKALANSTSVSCATQPRRLFPEEIESATLQWRTAPVLVEPRCPRGCPGNAQIGSPTIERLRLLGRRAPPPASIHARQPRSSPTDCRVRVAVPPNRRAQPDAAHARVLPAFPPVPRTCRDPPRPTT